MFERNIHTYTIKEQLKLHNSGVIVLGVGGGGCTISEILVRTGIGAITLVDEDVFESSNKNRQLGAVESTIGKYKVDVIGDKLLDINPTLKLRKIKKFITPENYKEILTPDDYIVSDSVDKLKNKLRVCEYCKDLKKTYVTGGLGGYKYWSAILKDGHISDIIDPSIPEVSCYPCASSVISQAALQAQQVINLILDRNWGTVDKVVRVNMETFTMYVSNLRSD